MQLYFGSSRQLHLVRRNKGVWNIAGRLSQTPQICLQELCHVHGWFHLELLCVAGMYFHLNPLKELISLGLSFSKRRVWVVDLHIVVVVESES